MAASGRSRSSFQETPDETRSVAARRAQASRRSGLPRDAVGVSWQALAAMPTTALPGPLVSARWLAARLGQPDLVILDASMRPVGGGPSPPARGDDVQLPGTQVFDFDQRICDRTSPLPHMMPPPALFEEEVRALGVRQDSAIVAYDRVGVYASPRAWWMFKAMGHDRVAVLDGGLPAWIEAGLPCEPRGERPVSRGDFVARPRPELLCDADAVAAALADARAAVVDARSEGRFSGRDPEPRSGLRRGHMPGAVNLPFSAVQAHGHMLGAEELAALFAARVGAREPLVFSCGSGVTACILALGATLAGRAGLRVYDGSWSEWGLPSDRPVVTG